MEKPSMAREMQQCERLSRESTKVDGDLETSTFGHLVMEEKKMIVTVTVMRLLCGQFLLTVQSTMVKMRITMKVAAQHWQAHSVTVQKIQTLAW
jgi:hypothetical protein